jgi:hypothetical protein
MSNTTIDVKNDIIRRLKDCMWDLPPHGRRDEEDKALNKALDDALWIAQHLHERSLVL